MSKTFRYLSMCIVSNLLGQAASAAPVVEPVASRSALASGFERAHARTRLLLILSPT